MTVREKIDDFNSIQDLLDYLEAAGIPTGILRKISKDLASLKNNVLSREDYLDKIATKIQSDRNNTLDGLGI